MHTGRQSRVEALGELRCNSGAVREKRSIFRLGLNCLLKSTSLKAKPTIQVDAPSRAGPRMQCNQPIPGARPPRCVGRVRSLHHSASVSCPISAVLVVVSISQKVCLVVSPTYPPPRFVWKQLVELEMRGQGLRVKLTADALVHRGSCSFGPDTRELCHINHSFWPKKKMGCNGFDGKPSKATSTSRLPGVARAEFRANRKRPISWQIHPSLETSSVPSSLVMST